MLSCNVMNIRKATSQDIETLLTITKACAKFMIQKGIFQWNENYPNRNAFVHDIERNELYVLLETDEIVGCIVISTFMDEEYKSVNELRGYKKLEDIYFPKQSVYPFHCYERIL